MSPAIGDTTPATFSKHYCTISCKMVRKIFLTYREQYIGKADREHGSQAVCLGQTGRLFAIVLQRLDPVGVWRMEWHRKGASLYTLPRLRHFLHANVLDV